jgi:hypothetical protein
MYNCYNYLEPCALNVNPPPPSPLKKGKTKSLTLLKKKRIGPYLK